jgi:serine phosphatase RsbU (regulator of sigma subunit)
MDMADILVVDDGPANIRLLAVMLSSLGYKVRKATTGEMALTAIETAIPDLVLLDVNMPGIDGYQVCQTLKADKRTHDIPVIFISALDEVMDKVKGFSVGGVDYITKPFQLAEVQVRIKTHLALRQLQKELQVKNQELEAERSRAGKIQADLLPKAIPALSNFELAARCLPSRDVGGDFYDWQPLKSGQINLTLGDVMGKGLPAALLMTTVRATLRALGLHEPPENQIAYAQALLSEDLGHSESFVTLFHGQLDCALHQLTYVDAGHGLGLLRRANGELIGLQKGGIPMGILPEHPYKVGQIIFQPQDALLLFSDGLLDVFPNATQNPDTLGSLLQGSSGAMDMLDRIFQKINLEPERSDDVTVLVLYYCGSMGSH